MLDTGMEAYHNDKMVYEASRTSGAGEVGERGAGKGGRFTKAYPFPTPGLTTLREA